MKFGGIIVAADSNEKTITIQCNAVSGVTMGKRAVLEIIEEPPEQKIVVLKRREERQPGE